MNIEVGAIRACAKRGQDPFVRSTLWAVPANWTCPLCLLPEIAGGVSLE